MSVCITPTLQSVVPRKNPAQRAFTGLAGSPLASVNEPTPQELKTKRGRPRKHANNAEKQAAYRGKQDEKKWLNAELETPKVQQQAWDAILKNADLSMNAGLHVKEAPQGCGELIYLGDRQKAEHIEGKNQIKDLNNGKRVYPKGQASEGEGWRNEKESDFAPRRFPKKWTLTQTERQMILEGTAMHKMFCRNHADKGLVPAQWAAAEGLWTLECGCSRGFCSVCNHPVKGLDSKRKCVCEAD
jgi:hypothetical protein